ACFVRGTCIDVANEANSLTEYKREALLGGSCDVIVQIKAFSEFKLQIMMQVNSSAGDLQFSSGIEPRQHKFKLGCYPDKQETNEKSMATERYGERQIF
ncbi:hypothetical protein PFISCL1PPCAC_1073, partial [Pristionchus fissidentatus]